MMALRAWRSPACRRACKQAHAATTAEWSCADGHAPTRSSARLRKVVECKRKQGKGVRQCGRGKAGRDSGERERAGGRGRPLPQAAPGGTSHRRGSRRPCLQSPEAKQSCMHACVRACARAAGRTCGPMMSGVHATFFRYDLVSRFSSRFTCAHECAWTRACARV